MISKKMTELVKRSSMIRAMFEEGARLAKIYGKENVFDFSLGNPNMPSPPEINAAIKEIVDTEPVATLHGYMNNSGYDDVRDTVAKSINYLYSTDFTSKNIIMTVGAAGGLNVIIKSLFDEGDELVTFAPFFGEYANYAANFNAKLVVVPANPPSFMPDATALAAHITPRTKAVIINSPNNPTGVIYDEKTIKLIVATLEAKQKEYNKSIYIISDEPYRELAYDGANVPFLTKYYKNTIIGYSFSKSLSLAGERIGYLIIPSEADASADILDAANVANRILGFVNAPSLQQKLIAKCIDAKVNVEAYDNNRQLLFNALTSYGFECAKPQGAFYLFVKSPIADDKEFVQTAKKYNILVVPGSGFGCSGYFRIAYCVSESTIINSLPAFKKLAEEYNLI